MFACTSAATAGRERNERTLVGELTDPPGLREHRDVGRVAAVDAHTDLRLEVAGALVLDLDAGVGGEGVERVQERLAFLLDLGPGHRDGVTASGADFDRLLLRFLFLGGIATVVIARAGRGDHDERQAHGEKPEPSSTSVSCHVAFPLIVPLQSSGDAGRQTGRLSFHELEREFVHTRVGGGRPVGVQRVEQEAGAEPAALEQGLAHRGQSDVRRDLDVVVADDGQLVGHPHPGGPRRGEHAGGLHVRRGEDRGRARVALQQIRRERLGRDAIVRSVRDHLGEPGGGQHLRVAPLARRRRDESERVVR